MKKFSGHTFIFIMLSVLVMSSCIYDYYADGDVPGSGTEDKMRLVLHIRSLDTRTTSSGAPTERIKSLRIIILNEEIEASDDKNAGQPGEDSENANAKADNGNTNETSKLSIEYNELIEFGTGYASNGFDYMFIKPTIPGKKHFYFIANEESVENIQFEVEGESGSKYTNLSEFLKAYEFQVPKDGQGDTENRELQDASEFVELLKSVYFVPEYEKQGDNIYLPYSTYYGGDEFIVQEGKLLGKLDEGQVIEKQMFLVPVATKFEFNFINNREHNVEINNITVSTSTTEEKTVSDDNDTQTTVVSAGLARHNFLLAHVCGTDVKKEFGNDSYYWVDWLDKVSKASWENQPFDKNISFNDKYGWIKNYEIPAVALTNPRIEVAFVSNATKKIVSAVNKVDEQNPIPGELSLGPYYLPESRQEETYKVIDEGKEVTKKEQRYYLTLGLHDESQNSSKDPKFEKVQISNLKALFRNTYVIINIKMSEGTVEAYAEIAPWNKKSINGWVTEGQAPSDNPFLTDSDANK